MAGNRVSFASRGVRSLLAVGVALLTSVGLVVSTAAPAQAIGWDNVKTMAQTAYYTTGLGHAEFVLSDLMNDAIAGSPLAPAMAELFGSPAEVRTAEKIATKCKGWSCLILPTVAAAAGVWYYTRDAEFWGEMVGPFWKCGLSCAPGEEPQVPLTWTATTAANQCGKLSAVEPETWRATGKVKLSVTWTEAPAWYGTNREACQPQVVPIRQCDGSAAVTGAASKPMVGPNPGASFPQTVVKEVLSGCDPGTLRFWKWGDAPQSTGQGYDRLPTFGEPDRLPTDRPWSRATCQDSVGDTYTSDAVTPDGQTGIPMAACNSGDTMTILETGLRHADGSVDVQSTVNLIAAAAKGAELYPDCAAKCPLEVKPAAGGSACTVGAAGCTDWASDPTQWRCYYGTYERPLRSCAPLERAYQTNLSQIPVTQRNTDGNPATWDGPTPVLTPTSAPTPTPTATAPASPNPSSTPTPTQTPSQSPTPTPSTEPDPQPSTPTPTPSVSTPVRESCQTLGYNLGPVKPILANIVNELGPKFSIAVVGGYREDGPEHTSGLAADFMTYTDKAKGQQLALYAQANAEALGVEWIIWDQHIWNVNRASEGWRLMADRGSATQNHMDHVHIKALDVELDASLEVKWCGAEPGLDGSGSSELGGFGGECFPTGWGQLNPAEWVLKPTKCALTWAFVPSDLHIAQSVNEVQTAWDTSSPGIWVGELSSIPGSFALAKTAECRGPAMTLPAPISRTIYPASACSGTGQKAASVVKTVLGAGLVVGGVFACLRMFGASISYGGFNKGGGEV